MDYEMIFWGVGGILAFITLALIVIVGSTTPDD